MTRTLIPLAVLVLVTIMGVGGLRRFPTAIRLSFDLACFAALSIYFTWRAIFPIFPPLGAGADAGALALRVVGGAWWLFCARLVAVVLWFTLHRDRKSRATRLFSDLSTAGIYLTTALIVLNSVFALPISGVVATSGVVAIVLGLALQNTLADVFAGFAVGIEAPFHVGDRIQLLNNVEGVVVQVNWRSTQILTDGDDLAIIPNSAVAKAEIINRSFPSHERADSVTLSCPDTALPEQVVETLLHATLLCPDLLQIPAPIAVLKRLGAKRNTYEVTFHVATSRQLGSTKDTLLRVSRRQLYYAGLLDSGHRWATTRLEDSGFVSRRLLRDVIVFECMSDPQLASLTHDLTTQRLEPGDILFAQDQLDYALYLIAGGVIEISRLIDNAPQILGCIGAGEYVGEIGLLTGAAHAATATAKTHCLVYRLPRESLAPLLQQNAHLVEAIDRSARKGLDALHREVVAQAAPEIGSPGQLLTRIQTFFGFTAASKVIASSS